MQVGNNSYLQDKMKNSLEGNELQYFPLFLEKIFASKLKRPILYRDTNTQKDDT